MEQQERTERQEWMRVLALTPPARLERQFERLGPAPEYAFVRPPETGMVMVRGRAGNSGMRFNVGEMTVSRCAVRLADGTVGHGYVAGRTLRHAELAALGDALMQRPVSRAATGAGLVDPLRRELEQEKSRMARETAATRVNFFTMVRGED